MIVKSRVFRVRSAAKTGTIALRSAQTLCFEHAACHSAGHTICRQRAQFRQSKWAGLIGIGQLIRPGTDKLADADEARPLALAELGALAADCVTRAVARGVFEAQCLGTAQSYRARFGG